MKLKRIFCFLLIAVLCLGLCGCRVDLDELREYVAYIQDSETLVRNGVEYRYVGEDLGIPLNTSSYVYVSEPDVPLLAVDATNSDGFHPSFDGVFLSDCGTYYCRADKFDEAKQVLENPPEKPTTYQLVYTDEHYQDSLLTLTKEQASVISKVVDEGTFTPLANTYPEEDDYYINIYACDDTGWVIFDELIVSWDVDEESDTRTYWISKATANDWVYDCLEVPAEYNETFNSAFGFVEETTNNITDEDWSVW